ncbi:MAG: hypothetical protein CFE32_05785 [Alphaproteobacteria bacterium PA3]|nr:MAG: hypothetical protein CFE32_05785 [Alphaproteobacteria bacterium PA3]
MATSAGALLTYGVFKVTSRNSFFGSRDLAIPWFLFALSLQVVSAGVAVAQSETWHYAIQSASPRVALFSLMREQPPGAEGVVQDLLAAQGLIPAMPPQVTWAVTPGLTYDRNINSGIAADELTLFGLKFVTDEATRAKAGWTPTLSFDVSAQLPYAEGAVLTAFSSAQSAYSFDHHLTKTDFTTGLCSANYLGRDWFFDMCLRKSRRLRDLGETQESAIAVTVEKIFALGSSVHSIAVSPQIERVTDKSRPLIGFSWRGVYPEIGVLSLNLLNGPALDGLSSTRQSLSIGLTRTILGAPMRLRVTVDQFAGQSYLGIARNDDRLTLTASRQIGIWAEVYAGYERNRSTIAGFNDDAALFGITLKGLPPQP